MMSKAVPCAGDGKEREGRGRGPHVEWRGRAGGCRDVLPRTLFIFFTIFL